MNNLIYYFFKNNMDENDIEMLHLNNEYDIMPLKEFKLYNFESILDKIKNSSKEILNKDIDNSLLNLDIYNKLNSEYNLKSSHYNKLSSFLNNNNIDYNNINIIKEKLSKKVQYSLSKVNNLISLIKNLTDDDGILYTNSLTKDPEKKSNLIYTKSINLYKKKQGLENSLKMFDNKINIIKSLTEFNKYSFEVIDCFSETGFNCINNVDMYRHYNELNLELKNENNNNSNSIYSEFSLKFNHDIYNANKLIRCNVLSNLKECNIELSFKYYRNKNNLNNNDFAKNNFIFDIINSEIRNNESDCNYNYYIDITFLTEINSFDCQYNKGSKLIINLNELFDITLYDLIKTKFSKLEYMDNTFNLNIKKKLKQYFKESIFYYITKEISFIKSLSNTSLNIHSEDYTKEFYFDQNNIIVSYIFNNMMILNFKASKLNNINFDNKNINNSITKSILTRIKPFIYGNFKSYLSSKFRFLLIQLNEIENSNEFKNLVDSMSNKDNNKTSSNYNISLKNNNYLFNQKKQSLDPNLINFETKVFNTIDNFPFSNSFKKISFEIFKISSDAKLNSLITENNYFNKLLNTFNLNVSQSVFNFSNIVYNFSNTMTNLSSLISICIYKKVQYNLGLDVCYIIKCQYPGITYSKSKKYQVVFSFIGSNNNLCILFDKKLLNEVLIYSHSEKELSNEKVISCNDLIYIFNNINYMINNMNID